MAEDDELLRSALHNQHVALEATMGEEAAWRMPLSYGGVINEVAAVRQRAGVIDVTHRGRLRIRGDGAVGLLQSVCTTDVAHQEDGTAALTLLCNDRGGIIDQCRLLRLEGFWVLVTSPMNRGKILEHLKLHAESFDVKIDDQTDKTAMLTVTGPAAGEILDGVLPEKVSGVAEGSAKVGSLLIARYIVMWASVTGEWGMDVILPNLAAGMAWDFITKKAGAHAVGPVGLAALDVLRIEAGVGRYGHEFNETIDPVTARLESAVCQGKEFLGAGAIAAIRSRGTVRRPVGLVLPAGQAGQQAAIPRLGATVWSSDGRDIGTVTSGTFSPTLGKVIAMAYVSPETAGAGESVLVGQERQPARICDLPFYVRGAKG